MIYQAITKSFLLELASTGLHSLTTDSLKIALYGSGASLDESTTAYTTSGEVAGAGYSAGGVAVVATVTQESDGQVLVDFADAVFPSVTLTARGAMIYNTSKSNKAIMVIDFGLDISRSGSDFTVRFPNPDADNAMVRIG